jgi:hypothetical protein
VKPESNCVNVSDSFFYGLEGDEAAINLEDAILHSAVMTTTVFIYRAIDTFRGLT